jgi:hypothetical protein
MDRRLGTYLANQLRGRSENFTAPLKLKCNPYAVIDGASVVFEVKISQPNEEPDAM